MPWSAINCRRSAMASCNSLLNQSCSTFRKANTYIASSYTSALTLTPSRKARTFVESSVNVVLMKFWRPELILVPETWHVHSWLCASAPKSLSWLEWTRGCLWCSTDWKGSILTKLLYAGGDLHGYAHTIPPNTSFAITSHNCIIGLFEILNQGVVMSADMPWKYEIFWRQGTWFQNTFQWGQCPLWSPQYLMNHRHTDFPLKVMRFQRIFWSNDVWLSSLITLIEDDQTCDPMLYSYGPSTDIELGRCRAQQSCYQHQTQQILPLQGFFPPFEAEHLHPGTMGVCKHCIILKCVNHSFSKTCVESIF